MLLKQDSQGFVLYIIFCFTYVTCNCQVLLHALVCLEGSQFFVLVGLGVSSALF